MIPKASPTFAPLLNPPEEIPAAALVGVFVAAVEVVVPVLVLVKELAGVEFIGAVEAVVLGTASAAVMLK
jgi:hypothetical protein